MLKTVRSCLNWLKDKFSSQLKPAPQDLLIDAIYQNNVDSLINAIHLGAKVHLSTKIPIQYLAGTFYEAHAKALEFMRLPPLHFAVALHQNLIIDKILWHDPETIWDKDYQGNTALHVASQHNHWQLLTVLTAKKEKPNIDVTNATGETALHLAASFGCTDAVRKLIHLEASTSIVNAYSFTPLQCANNQHHIFAADIIKEAMLKSYQQEMIRKLHFQNLMYELDKIQYQEAHARKWQVPPPVSWSYRF